MWSSMDGSLDLRLLETPEDIHPLYKKFQVLGGFPSLQATFGTKFIKESRPEPKVRACKRAFVFALTYFAGHMRPLLATVQASLPTALMA